MMPDITQYRQHIESALVYAGTHSFEDVAQAVADGRMQFWPGVASAVITEILAYPRYKALNIFLAGGNLAEIEAMAPGILAWGKQQGCERAIFLGREGWERTFLTRTGWERQKLVVFEKAL